MVMRNYELPSITVITFESSSGVVIYEIPWNAGANEIRNAIYFGMLDIRCNGRF